MGRKKRSKGSRPPKKKRKKGVMTSMRSGFRTAVRGSSQPASKRSRWMWNVVTGVLAIVAGLFIARRCGMIDF